MIVVTTPTGRVGRQVVARLLDSDEPVRLIARDPAHLAPETRDRVEVVTGSHHDPGVVMDAFAGADSVFWLVPPGPRADDVVEHYLQFTRPACEAITSHGVPRVVGVTSLGRGAGPNAGLLSAAWAMDELLERTGVAYRALQMPFFMENLLDQVEAIRGHGAVTLANAADRVLATCATRDIAAAAAALLLDRSWTGQQDVPVIGPDDLTPIEMVQTISDVLERPVRLQHVPVDAFRAALEQRGVPSPFARGIADMVTAQNAGIYDGAADAPRSPTSFRQWCHDVLEPAVTASS